MRRSQNPLVGSTCVATDGSATASSTHAPDSLQYATLPAADGLPARSRRESVTAFAAPGTKRIAGWKSVRGRPFASNHAFAVISTGTSDGTHAWSRVPAP